MMAEHRTIMAVCTSIFLVTSPLARQTSGAEIAINPQATFLRTNRDSTPLSPAIIGLAPLSISPGDAVRLQQLGDFSCGSPCLDDRTAMIGVFSSSTSLLSTDQLDRLPDAIEAGPDVFTSPTFFENLPTDIPEDFEITDATIVIPMGATYIFVAAHDSLYNDNTDPDGDFAIRITRLAGLPGDYNQNGVVDAADYVAWRDNNGTNHALPNDPIGGTIGQPQYDLWRSQFDKNTISGRAAIATAIPEPTLLLLSAVPVLWTARAVGKVIREKIQCDTTPLARKEQQQ